MNTSPIETALAGYREGDYTVKACRALFSAIPGAPPFVLYPDFAGAAARVGASGAPDATRLAAAESAFRATSLLDQADASLAALSGLGNLFALLRGGNPGGRMFEADGSQGVDAALKLLGLGWAAAQLFPEPLTEAPHRLCALPAGQEALAYYAAAEVALPFADNVLSSAGSLVARLVSAARGGSAFARFGGLAGLGAAEQAASMAARGRCPLEDASDSRGADTARPRMRPPLICAAAAGMLSKTSCTSPPSKAV